MQLLKPEWVTHEEKPIFSVDIHPKGGRFVTGGQGGDSGRVVIWNLEPVLSEKAEKDPSVPKLLCQMDNHLACVNIVRWSNEGHLLASGGDDKLVMIWKLTGEGSSSIFGGGGKVNVETWKCIATLNAHTGDVLDLAWAPHDIWLASCSVDNTAIVWNATKFPEKLAILKGHTGLVKGVAWDPVGKYLATQSDDRTLRIWRTSDWGQQELVTEPFEECSGTTHVLRLSWSPDGQYLVSAHAMNGGGPTAQIIEREGWKQEKDFVGHRKAVTCVRFNSNILQKSHVQKGSPKVQQYCCCAMGSRDRTLSVWLTSLKRPLVVVHDLFTSSVLDISWSSSGLHLLACSWDGTVACIQFTSDEIGKPLSLGEKNSLLERMYGKSLQKSWKRNVSNTQIVENPEMLNRIEEMAQKESQPKPISTTTTISYTSTPIRNTKPIPTTMTPVNKQIEVRLPDGKRRITPMLLTTIPTESAVMDIVPSTPKLDAISSSSPTKSRIIVEKVEDSQSMQPKNLFHPTPIQQTSKTVQRSQLTHATDRMPGIRLNAVQCAPILEDAPVVCFINQFDPLRAQPGITLSKICHQAKVQITNDCHMTPQGAISRLQVFKNKFDKEPTWETYLGSSVRCIAINRKLVLVCCEDRSMNCYLIATGARTIPPLVLEDLPVSLSLSETNICLILTTTGLMYMWNLETAKAILNRISIRNLLSGSVSVNNCFLSTGDNPTITLNDGKAFTYNQDLCTWVLLSNPSDPVSAVRSGIMPNRALESLPLSSLQTVYPTHVVADILPSGVTLSFLETQLASCKALNSPNEFQHWFMLTIEHLLDKGPEGRLRSILDELMGPTFKGAKQNNDTIVGLSKYSLLEEALMLVSKHLPWQRLYREYSEQLTMMKSST